MYPVAYQLIWADLDITHQAQIRTPWKIWILCHMSAYQNNFIIFWILEIMCIRHNSFFVTQSICWKPMATCLWDLHFRMLQLCVKLQHIEFWDKKHFARDLWHNLKMLEFPENEKYLHGSQRSPDVIWTFYNGVGRVSIASKNGSIIILFWYADIWHKFHIFQRALICAWWVISKSAMIKAT